MNNSVITLEIPKDIIISLNEDCKQISYEMKLYYALLLFKEHKLTIGQAAKLSDCSIYDFMIEAGKHNIPVIDYNEEDLEKELEILRKC